MNLVELALFVRIFLRKNFQYFLPKIFQHFPMSFLDFHYKFQYYFRIYIIWVYLGELLNYHTDWYNFTENSKMSVV